MCLYGAKLNLDDLALRIKDPKTTQDDPCKARIESHLPGSGVGIIVGKPTEVLLTMRPDGSNRTLAIYSLAFDQITYR
jgi:hypothetical protein